ncbi:MAG: hypothetical protein ABJL44_15435 [Algibacter sp.]
MNYFIITVVSTGLIYLGREYILYLKQRAKSEEATKRQENNILFICFISITGITSIFKNLILLFLEKYFPSSAFNKAEYYEWIPFAMFIILGLVFKLRLNNFQGTRNIQNHSGSGNNIGIQINNLPVKKNSQKN